MTDIEDNAAAVFKVRLQAARDRRKMSQQDLARKTGLQASSISHFETGGRRPSFDNLRRLADALNVSTDFLIGRTGEINTSEEKTADAIHRNLDKLSAYDLDIADRFVELLAKKDDDTKLGA